MLLNNFHLSLYLHNFSNIKKGPHALTTPNTININMNNITFLIYKIYARKVRNSKSHKKNLLSVKLALNSNARRCLRERKFDEIFKI